MPTQAQVQGLGEFGRRGFTLDHDGFIALLLRHEDELIARFSQFGATEKSIQAECARHLVMKHGWDGCLYQRGEEDED